MEDLDEAIIDVLPQGCTVARVERSGSSSFSVTSKITVEKDDGAKTQYFAKEATGDSAKTMLLGEYESIKAVHRCVSHLCPQPVGMGALKSKSSTYFFICSYHELSSSVQSEARLAEMIAKLHTTGISSNRKFGFDVATCCGSTIMDNTWTDTWLEFFVQRRLFPIIQECIKSQGPDERMERLGQAVADKVCPRLLSSLTSIQPSLVHGDLWSGNAGTDLVAKSPIIYDPCCFYAHNEYEIGIQKLFGGFSSTYYQIYHTKIPKADPVAEYEDRISLYKLYHQLNHMALFGGGYRSGAISTMIKLLEKYDKY